MFSETASGPDKEPCDPEQPHEHGGSDEKVLVDDDVEGNHGKTRPRSMSFSGSMVGAAAPRVAATLAMYPASNSAESNVACQANEQESDRDSQKDLSGSEHVDVLSSRYLPVC